MTEPARDEPLNLTAWPNWVLWRSEDRDGKHTKIPYTPTIRGFTRARANDEGTWASYKAARTIYARREQEFDGLGFVFSEEDPFCGVDIDGCITPENGIEDWALDLMEKLDTYAELSPSGTGVHAIAIATLPGKRRKNPEMNVEMYDRARFFTMTFEKHPDAPDQPQERQQQIEDLYERIFPEKPHKKDATPEPPSAATKAAPALPEEELSDEEIFEKLSRAQNATKFEDLYFRGAWSTYYDSKSEADAGLIAMLAFYTRDPARLEVMMSASALGKREKWHTRPDYRSNTISFVLSHQSEAWSPEQTTAAPDELLSSDDPRGTPERDAVYARDAMTHRKSQRARLVESPAVSFPVDALPQAAQALINEGSAAMGCAPDLIAAPALAVLSAGIGAKRRIEVKRGFTQLPALFVCVVASPGAMKTPAAGPALLPVQELQEDHKLTYHKEKRLYEASLRQYELDKAQARKDSAPAPEPPEAPFMKRTIASDTTIEALVAILEVNPEGILIYRDEIAGWVRSHDQYKSGGKGSDRQHWLSLNDGVPLTVDRKGNGAEALIVTKPFVSLFGGIQPRMLGELGGGMEDGLMDRFLFAYPATRHIRFSEATITRQTEIAWANLYDDLTSLKVGKDNRGNLSPKTLTLTFDALRAYSEEYDRYGADVIAPGFPARLEAVWSKARGHLARLALILAVCRCVEENITDSGQHIERVDVQKASRLMSYFLAHARRVYGVMEAADPLDLLAGDLKNYLEAQGGTERAYQGRASDLLQDLKDFGVEDLPTDPAAFTKKLSEVCARSETLTLSTGRNHTGRYMRLAYTDTMSLEPPPSCVTSVHSVTDTMQPSNEEEQTSIEGVTLCTGVTHDAGVEGVTDQDPPENSQPLLEGKGCINHPSAPDPACYLCNKNDPDWKPADGFRYMH